MSALSAAGVVVLALTTGAAAEEFDVDDGDVAAFISAINTANANNEPDTIHLAENGHYLLETIADSGWGNNGLPRIESEITIEGDGSMIERSSEDGTPDFRFFFLESSTDADLTLINLTLHNGRSSHGGAIRNWGNTVTLIDCTISNSIAVNNGGAIHSDSGGHITITGSTLIGNTGHRGGAINKHSSGGSVTISDSTIADNTATGSDGGGIHFEFGTLTITGTTISGNASLTHSGGGIRHQAGTLHITNSTISGNTANTSGGGMYNNNATVNMTHCTVAGNASGSTGGGVLSTGNNFTMSNSIVANSIGGEDVDGNAYNDAGYNIVEDGSGVSDPTSMSGDPMLGSLADNGGQTMTHALLPGSPAIDAGDCNGGAVTQDQRGIPRPQGKACDIGAVEIAPDRALTWRTVDSGGGTSISELPNEGLALTGTIGQPDTGVMIGSDSESQWTLAGGFWAAFGDMQPSTNCPTDLNDDNATDVSDLLALLGTWGMCDDPADCPADFNDDDAVDVSDLLTLLSQWGPCP